MGQNQTQPANPNAKEFEEIKLTSEDAIIQAKKIQAQELFISSKLGITYFEIKIEKGPWDMEVMISYVEKLTKMKCSYESTCNKTVFAINKEDSTPICEYHYKYSISGQNEIKENYKQIGDIKKNVEK